MAPLEVSSAVMTAVARSGRSPTRTAVVRSIAGAFVADMDRTCEPDEASTTYGHREYGFVSYSLPPAKTGGSRRTLSLLMSAPVFVLIAPLVASRVTVPVGVPAATVDPAMPGIP